MRTMGIVGATLGFKASADSKKEQAINSREQKKTWIKRMKKGYKQADNMRKVRNA